jgi:hypothetical protein
MKPTPLDDAYLGVIFPGITQATGLPLGRLDGEYRDKILPHGPDKASDPRRPVCDLLVDLAGNATTVAEYRAALLLAARTLIAAAETL